MSMRMHTVIRRWWIQYRFWRLTRSRERCRRRCHHLRRRDADGLYWLACTRHPWRFLVQTRDDARMAAIDEQLAILPKDFRRSARCSVPTVPRSPDRTR